VTDPPARGGTRIRAAEIAGSLCLATDLGMGFPFEHGLTATLTTMRLCDTLGVSSDIASQAYYVALLEYVGCNVDAEISVDLFRGSLTESGAHRIFGSPLEGVIGAIAALPSPTAGLPTRVAQVAGGLPRVARFRKPHFTAMCEVAEMLAEQLGLPSSISSLFRYLTERWDGWSHLRRAKGDDVPLPIRISHVGRDATYQRLIGDDDHVVATMRSRAGHAFDPDVAEALVANADEILGPVDAPDSLWEAVLAAEPSPWLEIEGGALDRALAAMGAFADLASPYLSGHSVGVGTLAESAAQLAGFDPHDVDTVRRAGYVLDIGRVSVHPRVWTKTGPLTADEWEQVRLHPYYTERVLARSSYLSSLARIASTHHERIDGSGYHRQLTAGSMTHADRLLAAADTFRSMLEARAHRRALTAEEAASVLVEQAERGTMDGSMVSAVVEAAGLPPPPVENPVGLTDREVGVVGMLARGMQTKQIARQLDISIKTADHHIQNAYRKMGVSSRAAATLFAAQHGLVQGGRTPGIGV
jgi:HD-GYP domain-containing protein (c-di-GMP phosphodiesterase class II)/DNA-binding CsgD family transcriptional regulator